MEMQVSNVILFETGEISIEGVEYKKIVPPAGMISAWLCLSVEYGRMVGQNALQVGLRSVAGRVLPAVRTSLRWIASGYPRAGARASQCAPESGVCGTRTACVVSVPMTFSVIFPGKLTRRLSASEVCVYMHTTYGRGSGIVLEGDG
jgi:hypothetical protein